MSALPSVTDAGTLLFDLSYIDSKGNEPNLSGAVGTATITPTDGQAAFTKAIVLDADPTDTPQAQLTIDPADYASLNLPVPLSISAPLTKSGITYVVDFVTSILSLTGGLTGGVTLSLDRLTRMTWGSNVTFASLKGGEKDDVRQAVEDAVTKLTTHGRFLLGYPGVAPGEWRRWGELEASLILAQTYRPDSVRTLQAERNTARSTAINTAASAAPSSGALQGLSFTWESIRRYVAVLCAKQQPRRVFPDTASMDAVIERVLSELYNRARWRFRTRHTTATIGTDKSVTWTLGTGETMDMVATRKLVFADLPNGPFLEPVRDPDHAASMRSDTKAKTGRPNWFSMVRSGDSWVYDFYPAPDKAYTVYAAVHLGGPRIPTGSTAADATAELADIPSEFHPHIRELALAGVLEQHGLRPAADRISQRSQAAIESLFYELDDSGSVGDDVGVRDVYGDMAYFQSGHGHDMLGGAM